MRLDGVRAPRAVEGGGEELLGDGRGRKIGYAGAVQALEFLPSGIVAGEAVEVEAAVVDAARVEGDDVVGWAEELLCEVGVGEEEVDAGVAGAAWWRC